MRKVICGIVVIFLFVAADLAAGDAELVIRPACGDHGISGMTSKDGITVLFEACEKSGHLKGKLEFEDGRPLAAISIRGQKIEMSIGGVDMAAVGSLPKEEQEKLEALFQSPEAKLAVKLPKRLQKIGFAQDSGTMKALYGLLMIFNQ